MKISGTRGLEAAQSRRAERRPGSHAGFHVEHADAARAAAPLGGLTALGAVDSLVALQGVSDASEGKRRAVLRAGNMLDLLDDIRVGLLEGQVPRAKLEGLLKVVQSRREAFADPNLAQILDEIELRAQVELAKFGWRPL